MVHAALGRFAGELGGLPGCMAQAGRETLDEAFAVPGAAWIKLGRFDWSQEIWIAQQLGGEGAVLDIGCGYGASSSVPFARKGRQVVGVDENLLFLLLAGRYARDHDLDGAAFACVDVARLPLPFGERAFDGVLAASFFNHYACLRRRAELREFLDEVARVAEPGGAFVANMVPNRLHPFPSEINLGEVITEDRLRRLAAGADQAPAPEVATRPADRDGAVGGLPRVLRRPSAAGLRAEGLPARGLEGGARGGCGRSAAHRGRLA